MSRKPLCLALAFHNHQPVGNFDGTMEECYQKSYLPFLDLISRPEYSSLRISLHNSGCLEEWLENRHPEYLDRLGELAREGRIEILGGPFQEPILAMLPSRDRIGQILMHSRWIENRLGVKVRGMWMPERVWEQSCVRDLVQAGMEFTILDDYHFKKAGLSEKKLYGYYLTEDDGSLMAVYPDSEKLRYWIPFDSIDRSLRYLREIHEAHENALLFCADDGEKFGAWPNTFEHVYGEGQWLARFFDALLENSSWLRTVTMSEARDETKPLGKCYLPDCSYREMTEWALDTETRKEYETLMSFLPPEASEAPENAQESTENCPACSVGASETVCSSSVSVDSCISDVSDPAGTAKAPTAEKELQRFRNAICRIRAFVSGGNWRNFKIRYPETNEMYCRMMAVSRRLCRLQNRMLTQTQDPGSPEYFRTIQLLEDARAELYRGQCNCPYWHGAFGGIYLPHLRNGIYRHLIAADVLLDRIAPNDETEGDFDLDGETEFRLETPKLSAWVSPTQGGMLYELDVRKTGLNLLAGMTRRPEPYHEAIVRTIEAQKRAGQTNVLDEDPGKDEDLGNIRDQAVFKQEGLEKRLQYDQTPRKAFLDFFYPQNVTAESLMNGETVPERTFAQLPYRAYLENEKLTLAAFAQVRSFEGNLHNISIRKTLQLTGDTLEFTWHLGNLPRWETLLFGSEFNFAGLPGHCEDRYFYDSCGLHLGDLSTCLNTKTAPFLGLADDWQKLRVELNVSRITDFWTFPVETVSNSEGGFELVHQAVCVIPHWFIRSENDSEWECRMTLQITEKK